MTGAGLLAWLVACQDKLVEDRDGRRGCRHRTQRLRRGGKLKDITCVATQAKHPVLKGGPGPVRQ